MSSQNQPEPVARVDHPAPRSGPRFDVVRLKGAQSLRCCILSPWFIGFKLHWDPRRGKKGRTRPCSGKPSSCEGCKNKLQPKELFYLFVVGHQRGRCFVELTPEAVRQLEEQLMGETDLRGINCTFARSAADNGRLRTELHDQRHDPKALESPVDPEPFLQWLWTWEKT